MRDRHSQQGSTGLRGGRSGARGGLPEKIFASRRSPRRISRRTARRSPAHTPIYAKTLAGGPGAPLWAESRRATRIFRLRCAASTFASTPVLHTALRQSGRGSSAPRSERPDRTVVMVEQKKIFERKHRRPPAPRTFSRTFSGILRGPFRGHAFHILRPRAEFSEGTSM